MWKYFFFKRYFYNSEYRYYYLKTGNFEMRPLDKNVHTLKTHDVIAVSYTHLDVYKRQV